MRSVRSSRGAFHKTIKKVTFDIENLKFNTAIAALMALMNVIADKGSISKGELRVFALLMNPFAPHVTEEVWEAMQLGEGMIAEQSWPKYDEAKCKDDTVEIVAQVNGKVRAKLQVPADIQKDDALAAAKAEDAALDCPARRLSRRSMCRASSSISL